MKNVLAVAFSLLSIAAHAHAATPTDRIAFDNCFYEDGDEYCNLWIARADQGGSPFFLGDGVEPTWSPDGSKIAFRGFRYRTGIFVLDLADWSLVQLAGGEGDHAPSWSPDGTKIAYGGADGIHLANVDGSGTVLLAAGWGRAAWSPDGGRLAYNCHIDAGYDDICAIDADGTGYARLTDDPALDTDPAFSPDGTTIAFATTRFAQGDFTIATMTATGGSVTDLGGRGVWPSWSPDGSRLVFFFLSDQCDGEGEACPAFVGDSMWIVNADGTGLQPFMEVQTGAHPAWTGWTQPLRPIANFYYPWCNDLHCPFNGILSLDPDGTIVDYAWDFGDGTTGSGATRGHTYAAEGTYTVTLIVTDDDGLTGTRVLPITVVIPPPVPPVAGFFVNCAEVACTFNGSSSWDLDGIIVAHAWDFGDGATGSGATATHTYAAAGVYTVTLTVTDDDGLTDTEAQALTVRTDYSHVGDLDGAVTTGQGTWTARVTATVHDTIEARLPNAVLTGYWSVDGGPSSCTTDAAGQCTVARSFGNAIRTVTFSVGSVWHLTKAYVPSQNHDPDGDSTGTSILVRRH